MKRYLALLLLSGNILCQELTFANMNWNILMRDGGQTTINSEAAYSCQNGFCLTKPSIIFTHDKKTYQIDAIDGAINEHASFMTFEQITLIPPSDWTAKANKLIFTEKTKMFKLIHPKFLRGDWLIISPVADMHLETQSVILEGPWKIQLVNPRDKSK
jgi:hypothetical protein|tara:strand:- start:5046 stop:5519 length:474 start_codon:yes stop_codon:yes gene_type:complete